MRGGPVPVATGTARREIGRRLTEGDGLLVALDFDGTLAPITDDPDEATIAPTCRRALTRFVTVTDARGAVISGRALADLRSRVGVDGLVYAGNHGLELRWGDHTAVHPHAAECRPAVGRTVERIADRLAGVPGWEIEDKGLTATVHVRGTPATRVDEVRAAVAAAVDETAGELRVRTGKQVFEVRPAVGWDKGDALARLAGDGPDGWRTVYLGDDVTDEDAFRAVGPRGVGVRVGPERPTAADYRLPTQGAVGPFLHWLADRAASRRRATEP